MMHMNERFQAFCRFCYATQEQDSALAAIKAAEEHEKACPRAPRHSAPADTLPPPPSPLESTA
jgi:hypothetical protein